MTTEVTHVDCLIEASEDGLDLFEMDQFESERRAQPSSVEFIQSVLKRFGQDVNGVEESK